LRFHALSCGTLRAVRYFLFAADGVRSLCERFLGGIMAFRDKWIEKRESDQSSANDNRNMSQMHWARRGVMTEEMGFVAGREKIDPELIRSEIARGRLIIPANVNHRNLEPMGIGIATKMQDQCQHRQLCNYLQY
jgi:hypothetical protein